MKFRWMLGGVLAAGILACFVPGCLGDVEMTDPKDDGGIVVPDAGYDGGSDAATDSGSESGSDACEYPDRPVDPCDQVVCDSPPGPCYARTGICVDGRCDYAFDNSAACDDSDGCTKDDGCQQGECIGTPVMCDTPPPSNCADADNLRVYESIGTCALGRCFYDSEKRPCPNGCEAGFCRGDPCLEMVCDQPPGPCFRSPGDCLDGICSYPPVDGAACDDQDGCTHLDTCSGGVCLGEEVVCNDPPPQVCLDTQTLATYSPNGRCEEGICHYPETTVDCEHGCYQDACMEPSEPAILANSHPGWIGTNCFTSGCHIQPNLPPNHPGSLQIPTCANCHGANGACYPCGRTTSCASCHGYKHGFNSTQQCNTCHYADEGIRYCY